MGGCGDGGSRKGGEEELINTVLTYEGNISDPDLPSKLSHITNKLKTITYSDSNWLVEKVEPWNSVRVTFSIPKEAAIRLHQLAQAGDAALKQLGILSVQVDGDQIVSLKVAGPNNEPTEIVLRPETAGTSGESAGSHSNVARSVTQALGGTGILPGFNQQHHHTPHPVPQFRSPSTEGGIPVVVGRPHPPPPQRPPQQTPYTPYTGLNTASAIHSRHLQQVNDGAAAPSTSRQTVYPSNPPPPYPTQGTPSPSQNNPSPPSILSSPVQSVTSNYRTNSAPLTANRTPVRTQVNMVKNSPLLVGLLQQPEQSAPPRPPPPKPTMENGSIPPSSSGQTYVGRSRDGLTTHQQIFSGGSVITNTAEPPSPTSTPLPPQRHLITSGFHQTSNAGPVSTAPSTSSQTSNKTPIPPADEPTKSTTAVTSTVETSSRNNSALLSSNESSLPSPLPNLNKFETSDLVLGSSNVPAAPAANMSKKENQYLINPNTGLLELRPSTDSSDSEAEGRISSLEENGPLSTTTAPVASDEESNPLRKELTDNLTSGLDPEAVRKVVVPSKPRDKDASPPTPSWENNILSCPNPGEKIKLRLKLGKEQVAQATIVGSKEPLTPSSSIGSGNVSPNEPRVPKLHIKLHSSQPVIIKTLEESEASSRKQSFKEGEKSKRKSNRKGRNNDLEVDSSKCKKVKSDYLNSILKPIDCKRSKFDPSGSDSNNSLNDLSKSKLDSKLRTRLKKPSMRKVGDLNSVGEIASYKILETLPPSITKVAAMHTQQPHRNPSSNSSPPVVQLSSIAPSLFNSSSSPSSDQLKAELEKRGSEIIPKSDVVGESDSILTKIRLNSQLKTLMNGDVSHSEKLRLKASSSATGSDFSAASKLTIKRKGSDERHTLEALKKEGLGTVPTFLNSSVLINKVSSEKSGVISNLVGSHRHSEDLSEKFLAKGEGLKGPLRGTEMAGLKSNTDITMHSVSKSEMLRSLSKSEMLERRVELLKNAKPKSEVAKVGRVTCVDVMDRKALEEALKSSRISSKKNVSLIKSTSSMVDRLRRWNSIDSSNSVPFSSHSQQQPQTEESTNLYSMGMKAEPKESGDGEMSLGKKCVSLTNTVNNVNKTHCDSSSKDINTSLVKDTKDELNVKKEDKIEDGKEPKTEDNQPSSRTLPASSSGKEPCKISDLVNPASLTKVDAESPEGTPKGEHGNGQGGEDSGIESMDALSEKSPNHSDQSPNRREEKECEIFPPEKCKERITVPSNSEIKDQQTNCSDQNDITKENFCSDRESFDASEKSEVLCNSSNQSDSQSEQKFTEEEKKEDVYLEAEGQQNIKVEESNCIKTSEPSILESLILRQKTEDPLSCLRLNALENEVKKEEKETSLVSSISLTTTSISISSPKSTFVSSPSVMVRKPQPVFAISLRNSSSSSQGTNNIVSTSKSPIPSTSTCQSGSGSKSISSIDGSNSSSNLYCHSLACNNNSLTFSNSYSANAVTTTATMIILAGSTTNSITTSCTPVNNTKVVTLKQGLATTTSAPMGKTFRLVAVPNTMNQNANPVKGQLVTIKPVATGSSKVSLLQTISVPKTEEHSVLKNSLGTLLSPIDNNGTHQLQEDLDFVGFSSPRKQNDCKNILPTLEEEPTPLRVHPPLYTYGNRERKKEMESDAEAEKHSPSVSAEELKNKPEMDALTIEIPNAETFAEDKRLTRSTRHSARLASPKVNNNSPELSPKGEANNSNKKPSLNAMGKPSPVGVLRASTSPALRTTNKRRRHESESSNASNVSEDTPEPPCKTSRRKTNQENKEDVLKPKSKSKEYEHEKDGDSSEDEIMSEDGFLQKRNMSNEEDEDSRARSTKAVTRSKDKSCDSRDTTPTRRRQGGRNCTSSPSNVPSQNSSGEKNSSEEKVVSSEQTNAPNTSPPEEYSASSPSMERLSSTPTRELKEKEKKLVAVVKTALVKTKKETIDEQESSGRRKTRSTANTVVDDANKRRRLSKDITK